ncbi:hypothetical protein [Moraxella lacunata]
MQVPQELAEWASGLVGWQVVLIFGLVVFLIQKMPQYQLQQQHQWQ